MSLLKKTIRSTEKVLEKFAKYEEVKKQKRNRLVQKGIDFFMDTLGVSLLDINVEDESDEQIDILLRVVRAHVAAANELAGNYSIPEDDEIITMFEGFELP